MEQVASIQEVSRPQPAHPLIESDSVEGITVYGTHGKSVGAIKRLVVEKLSGRVVYAVVGFGRFLSLGQEFYTVPWGKLSFDQDLNGFRTDLDENQLREAPRSSILESGSEFMRGVPVGGSGA